MKKNKQKYFWTCLLFTMAFALALPALLTADTITTKGGKKYKGIVVEQYEDRFLFSTYKGEIMIMKSDIKDMKYDSEVDNLISLGETYMKRNDYEKAYYYYSRAHYMFPDSKKAKDGYMLLKGSLFAKEQQLKKDMIRRRKDIERWRREGAPKKKSDDEIRRERQSRIKTRYGIDLVEINSKIYVRKVYKNTPGHIAKMRKGDIIISLWGKMLSYMAINEVFEILASHKYPEIKMVIQRDLLLKKKDAGFMPFKNPLKLIGASFETKWDGMTVTKVVKNENADEAGLIEGDIIHAINNKITRYTPLSKAVSEILNDKDSQTLITVRRDISLWIKKEEL